MSEDGQREQHQTVPVGGQGGGGRSVSTNIGPGRPLLRSRAQYYSEMLKILCFGVLAPKYLQPLYQKELE